MLLRASRPLRPMRNQETPKSQRNQPLFPPRQARQARLHSTLNAPPCDRQPCIPSAHPPSLKQHARKEGPRRDHVQTPVSLHPRPISRQEIPVTQRTECPLPQSLCLHLSPFRQPQLHAAQSAPPCDRQPCIPSAHPPLLKQQARKEGHRRDHALT